MSEHNAELLAAVLWHGIMVVLLLVCLMLRLYTASHSTGHEQKCLMYWILVNLLSSCLEMQSIMAAHLQHLVSLRV